ncbi:hypothetical protein FB451DRAFT_1292312, partial [Mycena latifolia]
IRWPQWLVRKLSIGFLICGPFEAVRLRAAALDVTARGALDRLAARRTSTRPPQLRFAPPGPAACFQGDVFSVRLAPSFEVLVLVLS